MCLSGALVGIGKQVVSRCPVWRNLAGLGAIGQTVAQIRVFGLGRGDCGSCIEKCRIRSFSFWCENGHIGTIVGRSRDVSYHLVLVFVLPCGALILPRASQTGSVDRYTCRTPHFHMYSHCTDHTAQMTCVHGSILSCVSKN